MSLASGHEQNDDWGLVMGNDAIKVPLPIHENMQVYLSYSARCVKENNQHRVIAIKGVMHRTTVSAELVHASTKGIGKRLISMRGSAIDL